jgi:hypothetical protein
MKKEEKIINAIFLAKFLKYLYYSINIVLFPFFLNVLIKYALRLKLSHNVMYKKIISFLDYPFYMLREEMDLAFGKGKHTIFFLMILIFDLIATVKMQRRLDKTSTNLEILVLIILFILIAVSIIIHLIAAFLMVAFSGPFNYTSI